MQYILSEEEYQRCQKAIKDAEAARSDEAKLDAYASARDAAYLAGDVSTVFCVYSAFFFGGAGAGTLGLNRKPSRLIY